MRADVKTGILFAAAALLAALALAGCGGSAAAPADEVMEAPAQEPAEGPAEQPAEAPMQEAAETPAEEAAPAGGALTFEIVAEESEARFIIDEVLNGAPKVVVGTTNAVSGSLLADYADTTTARVEEIRVDLSTLATDNNFRNRAIRDFILNTGNAEYQYATFVSTAISGLPGSVTVGETYPVQITGNLTIRGVTNEVTFEGQVTPVSETRIEGSASLEILYNDFGVNIARLPEQVASVEDTTVLEIDFVAVAP
jgi:polyisoprenoid-binding protein YceI